MEVQNADGLVEKYLWEIVSRDEIEPENESNSNEMLIQRFRKHKKKVFAKICLSLGGEQLSLVRSAKTAKEVWERLENHYEVKSLANKLFLRKKILHIVNGSW